MREDSSSSRVPFGLLRSTWKSRLRKRNRVRRTISTTTPAVYPTDPPKVVPERKPRPRHRRGKGARIKDSCTGSSEFIYVSSEGPKYNIKKVSESSGVPGCRLRRCLRWFPSQPMKVEMALPHIDKLGRYSGFSAAHWTADPRQIVSSTVSTISRRLLNRCLQHEYRNKWRARVEGKLDLIVRLSAYYALTKDLYFWNRVLFLSKSIVKNGALLHRLLVFRLAKADANIRFVYSHVSLQTKWLLFRAERPRDKSALNSQRKQVCLRTPHFREAFSRTFVNSNVAILKSAVQMSEL